MAVKHAPARNASYERRKANEAARQRQMAAAGQEIGPIPRAGSPKTRAKCAESLQVFCETLFPGKFSKGWSDDHLMAINRMERAIREGDLFALAMPRGHGKTTLTLAAVLWAIVCGYQTYIAIIGPTKKHAVKLLAAIKLELETNDQLHQFWPEASHPVRSLERIPNRCNGQKLNGNHTYIQWGKELIVLATVPNAKCSGAVVEAVGITGSVRGMQQSLPDGRTIRPGFVVIDDPQTKASAKSRTQVESRLEVISGDVLGLAGPGQRIAGFCLCTVVEKDDVADQLLNRETHPDWNGQRCQMVYDWPTNRDLWDKYAVIRAEDLAAGNGLARATKFYKANRKEMDLGSKVSWEERYNSDEISAIQHAENLRLRDPVAFAAEYQNEPASDAEDADLLSIDQIQAKTSGYLRGIVPPEANTLTAFIDVQGQLLYYLVAAWRVSDFSGWVIDYGTWPDQGIPYFSLSAARKTLARKYPGTGLEGRLRAGLMDLVDHLAGKDWPGPAHETGETKRTEKISRIGIDAAWGPSTKIVSAVCRESPHASILLPYFGRPISATQKPMEEWAPQTGERRGFKWMIRPSKNTQGRHVLSDVNTWKTFFHHRLSTAAGDPGSLVLFKPRLKTEHRMLAEHWKAENRQRVIGPQRECDQWTLPPNKPDNHLLDCGVGASVMASISGATLQAHRPTTAPSKKKRRGYVGSLQC